MRNTRGITLLEVVAIVAILGLLSASTTLSVGSLLSGVRQQSQSIEVGRLNVALENWTSQQGCLPAQLPPTTTGSDGCLDTSTPPLWPQLYNPAGGGAIPSWIRDYTRTRQIQNSGLVGAAVPGAASYGVYDLSGTTLRYTETRVFYP
ncbi:type II secretion system protein [Anthocerotibacter panamensis]|uniref:type II secretion system protein n=1 Tax=Anthocerotibacter panamensis TaxID=2857077 RepID=UPI001C40161C|nr:type II secretion system GspH family protein [Anthocerotibacter panamensis]